MANAPLTEAVFYILLALKQPNHGYGIMQDVEQMSAGRLRLAAGTLYGALTALIDKSWIEALPEAQDSRRKQYRLTPNGIEALRDEIVRLEELVANGRRWEEK